MKKKKAPSDAELLVQRWTRRVKFHKNQLTKTRKFHREVEAGLAKKIKFEEMQLTFFKKQIKK